MSLNSHYQTQAEFVSAQVQNARDTGLLPKDPSPATLASHAADKELSRTHTGKFVVHKDTFSKDGAINREILSVGDTQDAAMVNLKQPIDHETMTFRFVYAEALEFQDS